MPKPKKPQLTASQRYRIENARKTLAADAGSAGDPAAFLEACGAENIDHNLTVQYVQAFAWAIASLRGLLEVVGELTGGTSASGTGV